MCDHALHQRVAITAPSVASLARPAPLPLLTPPPPPPLRPQINMYYSAANQCVKGIKAQYGWDAKNSDLIGSNHKSYNTVESDITLGANEYITKVEIAAGE